MQIQRNAHVYSQRCIRSSRLWQQRKNRIRNPLLESTNDYKSPLGQFPEFMDYLDILRHDKIKEPLLRDDPRVYYNNRKMIIIIILSSLMHVYVLSHFPKTIIFLPNNCKQYFSSLPCPYQVYNTSGMIYYRA